MSKALPVVNPARFGRKKIIIKKVLRWAPNSLTLRGPRGFGLCLMGGFHFSIENRNLALFEIKIVWNVRQPIVQTISTITSSSCK